jgi:hypothetical protein
MPAPETSHAAREAAIAAALVDTAAAPPAGLLGRDGGPVGRRFAVHRATTTFGLIGALATRYPATRRLLGDDYFDAVARVFIAGDRPRTALLLDWGEAFPDALTGDEAAVDWPFLADVARLENAWTRAHHAAEATPIGLADLARIDPETLAASRVALHPSAALVASAFPIATLWAAHQGDDEPAAPEIWEAERVLVVRPEADVLLHRLTPAGHAFVEALLDGAPIAQAADDALAADPAFDVGGHVVALVRLGAITALAPDTVETDR